MTTEADALLANYIRTYDRSLGHKDRLRQPAYQQLRAADESVRRSVLLKCVSLPRTVPKRQADARRWAVAERLVGRDAPDEHVANSIRLFAWDEWFLPQQLLRTTITFAESDLCNIVAFATWLSGRAEVSLAPLTNTLSRHRSLLESSPKLRKGLGALAEATSDRGAARSIRDFCKAHAACATTSPVSTDTEELPAAVRRQAATQIAKWLRHPALSTSGNVPGLRSLPAADDQWRRAILCEAVVRLQALEDDFARELDRRVRAGLGNTRGGRNDRYYHKYSPPSRFFYRVLEVLLPRRIPLNNREIVALVRCCIAIGDNGVAPPGRLAQQLRYHREAVRADSDIQSEIRRLLEDSLYLRPRFTGLIEKGSRPTDSPSPFDSMLLGGRPENREPADAIWDRLHRVLVVPQSDDHATPARFGDCEGVSAATVEAINRILTDPPEHCYDEKDVAELCSRRFRRTNADFRAVLAAVVALGRVDIAWQYQDERSERFINACTALIGCSRVLFGTIRASDVETIQFTWEAFSHCPYDDFREPWIIDLLEFTLKQPATFFASLPLGARWSLLRFREYAACSGASHIQQFVVNLDRLLGIGLDCAAHIGEPWTLAMVPWVRKADSKNRALWFAFLHASGACTTPLPNRRVQKAAGDLGRSRSTSRDQIARWLRLFALPRPPMPGGEIANVDSTIPFPSSARTIRGIIWLCPAIADATLVRELGALAMRCFAKVAGRGPRCILVGNAAIWALGQIPGPDALGQLAMLRVKVKFIPAQKAIEKALTAAATREGLPRAEIEELGVPTYGLTELGLRREELGDTIVELSANGGEVGLRFFKKTGVPAGTKDGRKRRSNDGGKVVVADGIAVKGKEIKSVPASVKKDFADNFKELKAAAKDLASMLSAQRNRIDSMFLDNRSWPLAAWRERYLNHPVVGVIARRLIWTVTGGGTPCSVLHHDGQLVNHRGEPSTLAADSVARLWHPVEAPADEVLAWRRFIEERQIRQPFKQAHREVYLLTDAERRTNTYSNRFAAHIVRQHQFHALCGQRNWRNRLRLFVDGEFPPPTKHLPHFGMRAEFWVQEAGEETLDSGAFVYLATDQVRFYRADAAQITSNPQGGGFSMTSATPDQEPIAIEQVPPLVLSEVLRDCDLFVGVSSVGNNPAWNDGGPGEFRDYWHAYSFGDLSATAETRRDLLSRLIPRLKIADRCSLSDRFLVVRGNIRTYKIHLGSGNILMEPNDQYLCIVPSSSGSIGGTKTAGASGVFLPFEGDRTLSIILSKAFLLAADDMITDATITRQIKP